MNRLEQQLHDHPWSTIAFAALAGVWLATHGKSNRNGVVAGALSAVAITFVRGAAMRQMTKLAKDWVAASAPPPPTVPTPYAT